METTLERIEEIYAYREMIFTQVHRNLRGRYKGSALGFLWTFLNPLFQLIVYTILFSVIMQNKIEQYSLFLFVTLIPWIFFGTCMSEGSGCLRDMEDMVKKIYFPREVIPISYVVSQFINMLLCFIIVLVALLVAGRLTNPAVFVFLPLIMGIEFCLTIGLVFITSAWCVYLRDVKYMMTIITMAWQFMTPVMYSVDMIPGNLVKIFYLNPMTSVIVAYRDILYYQQAPEIDTLIIACIMGIGSLVVGWHLFNKLKRKFAEYL
ncbi:ABC transporter permease [Butyrivibrio sp. VCD2006]|uniref:ABC transporter permease n=1 Tax=Butyrivibrio sp. VCD2006 TaxID=1280664 RepID=UPI0003F62EF3|nr:ABC transporter permease [Butyrivibrio sp. VCD2006]